MKTTSDNIKSPAKEGDFGYDIFASDVIVLPPHSDKMVKTGVNISLPEDHMGLVVARSGLSKKKKIEVGAGGIDRGFTGEIEVHLYNNSDQTVVIPVGKACCQLAVLKCYTEPLEKVDNLETSERGESGFGSTDSENN